MNAFIEIEPALKEAVDKFRQRYTDFLEEFRAKMTEHRRKKDAEVEEFEYVLNKSKSEAEVCST